MKFVLMLVTFICVKNVFASEPCEVVCANSDEWSTSCLELDFPSKFASKTIIDLVNLFKNPKIPNVLINPCPRVNSVFESTFSSTGGECTEWSYDGFQEDHSKYNWTWMQLPSNLSGTYNQDTKTLYFTEGKPLPKFGFQTDGDVSTSGDVDYVTEIVRFKREHRLVLATKQACYSVIVDTL